MTEELFSPSENPRKRVVLVGAGDAGLGLAKELVLNPNLAVHPVAIVDDDSSKHGTTIYNVLVVGCIRELERLVRNNDVDEVFICIPSATRSEISKILAICLNCEIPVRTLPSLGELIYKPTSWRELRQPCIEDILQRAEILLETTEIRELIQGKAVLVSGAGGSIGSELCRQVAAADPGCLLLLDKSENSLFYRNLEIRDHFPNLQTHPLLLDVVQRQQVERVFREFRPELVFHAAAFKHVGLCEGHPVQTIYNNVIGTRNIAVAAASGGVHRFVNISTDKAVNPRSIMGLSKKLTELSIQEISRSYPGRFSSVRFGNVAGSTGSVIRLFWDQIQKGGPLRITDSRATRYFIAIPEAVYLIIRAAQLCGGGETFVFDMGKPISILELAKTLCLLSGLKPYVDIPIEFVGIQEGEKINEELWEDWEKPERTSTEQILVIPEQDPRSFGILKAIEKLESHIEKNDVTEIVESTRHLCSDFRRTWGDYDPDAHRHWLVARSEI